MRSNEDGFVFLDSYYRNDKKEWAFKEIGKDKYQISNLRTQLCLFALYNEHVGTDYCNSSDEHQQWIYLTDSLLRNVKTKKTLGFNMHSITTNSNGAKWLIS